MSANRNGAANIIRCASGRVYGFKADSMAPTSAVTGNSSIRTFFYIMFVLHTRRLYFSGCAKGLGGRKGRASGEFSSRPEIVSADYETWFP